MLLQFFLLPLVINFNWQACWNLFFGIFAILASLWNTHFILTFAISDLLSKSKPCQVYFNNREYKFERVTFNAINAHNAEIITINFVTSPWTGNKVNSYGLVIKLIVVIAGIDSLEYYSLKFIISIVKINLGIPYSLIKDLIITSPPLGHIVLEINWGSAYSAIFTFICLTIWF